MKDWLEELQAAQLDIGYVQSELDIVADGLALAGIGEDLRGRLRRLSYMLHETNLAVHRGTSGASSQVYDSAVSGTYNMVTAALAMCELGICGCGEEEDGQDHGT